MRNPFLEKLQGFGELQPEAVSALIEAMETQRDVAAKTDLIREGDRPGPVFVVLSGWSCRYKILPSGSRQVLAYLMPGDCCDLHVGLLAEMDHNIQTITPCRIATIPQDVMSKIVATHPGFARAMYVAQLIDEGTMRAWITSMGRRSSIERVAHLMCELYLRARNVGLAEHECLTLPLSQHMLADSLGMTAVHVNRVLKELRIRGAMTLSRGSLTITSPGQLAQIAGFDENYLHRRQRAKA